VLPAEANVAYPRSDDDRTRIVKYSPVAAEIGTTRNEGRVRVPRSRVLCGCRGIVISIRFIYVHFGVFLTEMPAPTRKV